MVGIPPKAQRCVFVTVRGGVAGVVIFIINVPVREVNPLAGLVKHHY